MTIRIRFYKKKFWSNCAELVGSVYYSGPTSKSRISCCLHNLIICILVLYSQRKTNAFQFQKRVSIQKSIPPNNLGTGYFFLKRS